MPKMALLEPNFIAEIKPHRFPAGAVIDVDEATAVRWMEERVAEPATKTAQTYREKRRAELLAELEAVESSDDDVPIITLSATPTKARTGRRPKAPKPVMIDTAPLTAETDISGFGDEDDED